MRIRASMSLFVLAAALAGPRVARADEPIAASEPRLLDETAEVTTVADAFDRDNPFDLHIYAAFIQSWKRADIHRETALSQPGLSTGGFVANTENVARFSEDTSVLDVGADIGLFHDLALVFRMPIILSDSRTLGDLNGSSQNPQRLQDPTGAQLFNVPFQSPTRSGLDYLAIALDWAPSDQQRDHTKPTWVLGVEGRIPVGDPLHACNAAASGCPVPSDHSQLTRSPGVSRAMWGLDVKTVISKRFGYVEPYTGFEALFSFPRSDSDMGTAIVPDQIKGALVSLPPIVGTFTMGLEWVPWERREAFQRLVFDVRVQGIYNSPGREYSELFDALGSSNAPTLTQSNAGAYTGPTNGPSARDTTVPPVYFTGITDQSAYGAFGAQASVTWQAGEYVKFGVGGGVRFNQSHTITSADPCNPGYTSTIGNAGPCTVTNGSSTFTTGIPDPNYRAIIDTPGRRFSADNTVIGNFNVSATLMF
jgi:hypothetical protein